MRKIKVVLVAIALIFVIVLIGLTSTKKEEVNSIAIFSHGGSSSAVMSHLTNVSFIHFCGNFQLDFTSISVISLANNVGSLVCPKVEGLNDHKHIFGI